MDRGGFVSRRRKGSPPGTGKGRVDKDFAAAGRDGSPGGGETILDWEAAGGGVSRSGGRVTATQPSSATAAGSVANDCIDRGSAMSPGGRGGSILTDSVVRSPAILRSNHGMRATSASGAAAAPGPAASASGRMSVSTASAAAISSAAVVRGGIGVAKVAAVKHIGTHQRRTHRWPVGRSDAGHWRITGPGGDIERGRGTRDSKEVKKRQSVELRNHLNFETVPSCQRSGAFQAGLRCLSAPTPPVLQSQSRPRR